MGVPAFFRWLLATWPSTVQPLYDEFVADKEVDWTLPNPNGPEVDCLYLDMNGIIHPCFHPAADLPSSEEEVFRRIDVYVDHVVWLARPRKLLFLALDGVAPRAKLNQQRARRFQAAKEYEDAERLEGQLRAQWGFTAPPHRTSREDYERLRDSNVITPGTVFMDRLSEHLQRRITAKLHTNWQHLHVILSDSSVPGEGEHKLVDFIRQQRTSPSYDATTSHCIYGADADLIFLALCTHEPNFSILREEVREWVQETPETQRFCSVNIRAVRDALHRHAVGVLGAGFPLNLERLLDDFVLLCCLCGNDFVPNLPSLSMRDGDVSRVILQRYYEVLGAWNCYITDEGMVDRRLLAAVVDEIAEGEALRLKWKEMDAAGMAQRRSQKVRQALAPMTVGKRRAAAGPMQPSAEEEAQIRSRVQELISHGYADDVVEDGKEIAYGSRGWCRRYYTHKFKAVSDSDLYRVRWAASSDYADGLGWVMQYYHSGCPSWGWYYPHAHAPLAVDLCAFLRTGPPRPPRFRLGEPFRPFQQLVAVLPPQSAHALPAPLRPLMQDPKSPLAHFFPAKWKIDFTHKFWKWQGHVLLPIMDERQLRAALGTVLRTATLTPEEAHRNRLAQHPLLAVHAGSPVGACLQPHGRRPPPQAPTTSLTAVGYPWGAVTAEFPRQPLRHADRRLTLFAANPLLVRLHVDVRDRRAHRWLAHIGRVVYRYAVEAAPESLAFTKMSAQPQWHSPGRHAVLLEDLLRLFEAGTEEPPPPPAAEEAPAVGWKTPDSRQRSGDTSPALAPAEPAVQPPETLHPTPSGRSDAESLGYLESLPSGDSVPGSPPPAEQREGPEVEALCLEEGEEVPLVLPEERAGKNFLIVDDDDDDDEPASSGAAAVEPGPQSSPAVAQARTPHAAEIPPDRRQGMQAVVLPSAGQQAALIPKMKEWQCMFL
eukprot:EG_transcript_2268